MAALHALSIGYSLLSLVYQQCSLFHRLPLNLFCFIKSTFDWIESSFNKNLIYGGFISFPFDSIYYK